MKIFLLTALMMAVSVPAFASCTYADDTASDGSRCGGRAASERPGGIVPFGGR